MGHIGEDGHVPSGMVDINGNLISINDYSDSLNKLIETPPPSPPVPLPHGSDPQTQKPQEDRNPPPVPKQAGAPAAYKICVIGLAGMILYFTGLIHSAFATVPNVLWSSAIVGGAIFLLTQKGIYLVKITLITLGLVVIGIIALVIVGEKSGFFKQVITKQTSVHHVKATKTKNAKTTPAKHHAGVKHPMSKYQSNQAEPGM